MKFTLSWLREHLDTDASIEAIAVDELAADAQRVAARGALLALAQRRQPAAP